MIIIILFSIFIAISTFFIFSCLLDNFKNMKIEGKIHNAMEKKKNKSFLMPVLLKRADNVGKLFSKISNSKFKTAMLKLDNDLKILGQDYKSINAYQFLALQFFAAFAGALFCAVFISTNPLFLLILAFVSFYIPMLKIKENIKTRKDLIFQQLPDMADLLAIMLSAGSDFFGAIDKVTEILKGPLSDEFEQTMSKITLGYDKKRALSEMAQKCGVEQLDFFVRTINMSLDSGVGMADTLKKLAKQIRNERAMSAEKKAQEAPIKMLIPLVIFIFPTIFIVIFGPIAINFMTNGGF